MSSICPNCGDLMDGGVCKTCQMNYAKRKNTKKAETQGDQMNIVSGICFSIVALLLITVFSWAYSYGDHVIKSIAEEKAIERAEVALKEAVLLYDKGDYYKSLDVISHIKYRGMLEEKDAEIDELYNLVEQRIYERAMSLSGKDAVKAGNAYIKNFPSGKHLEQINLLIETNKLPDALPFIRWLKP